MKVAKKYKFSLREGSKKEVCPNCGKKEFKPYVDVHGVEAGEKYGRCERINNCGYNHYPKGAYAKAPEYIQRNPVVELPTTYIAQSIVNLTLQKYETNIFYYFLINTFGQKVADELKEKYIIGTSQVGGAIFWQKDFTGRYRTAKTIQYNLNGKRKKGIYSYYIHKRIADDFVLKQCFFGEHLLAQYPDMDVALCESEKTAVMMSVYMPQYVWIASGGSEMLNPEKFAHLHGRKLTVFPDEGLFKKWSNKTAFIKDRIMDKTVEEAYLRGECEKGADILDLYIK
jgi:hypothetical protein